MIQTCYRLYDPITFGFIHRNGLFWYLITYPVKYDMQQMLILKVKSENVVKVQKSL